MGRGEVKYRVTADTKPFESAMGVATKEFEKFTGKVTEGVGILGKVADAAGPVGKALVVTAGVGVTAFGALAVAITSTVKGLVETGGHLADLSAQTGISTQALQKLAYAGSLVGVSQEQITGAAVKMEKALANGDSVFQRLGLSVSKLRAMQPDQAFAAIASQIARIKDPANQAAAAMEVFGKSGATLLPLIKSDLAGAAAEAERLGIVLDTKTVDAADALGDEATKLAAAWEGVKNQFAASIIQNPALLQGLHSIVEGMGQLAQWLMKNREEIGQFTASAVAWGRSFVDAIEKVGAKLIAIGSNPAVKFLNSAMLKVAGYATGVGFLAPDETGPSAGSGTGHMSAGSSYAAIKGGGGVDFTAKGSAAAAAAAQKAAAEAAKAWTESAEKSRQANDKFVADYKNGAYQQMLGIQNLFDKRAKASTAAQDAELKAEMAHRDALMKLGAENEAVFEAMEAKKVEKLRATAAAIADLGDAFGGSGAALAHFAADGINALANLHDKAIQTASTWQKVTMAIEGAAAAYNSGKAAGSPGKGALAGAGKGAAAGAAFGPYGMVIGAAAGAAIGFFGGKKAQKEELNDLRSQLAALEQAAAKAGITFSHTFDTSKAAGLKKAIEEIQGALDTNQEAQEKLNDAVERYGFTIEELGPAMQRQELDKQAAQLYQDWQLLTASGIDVTTVTGRMSDAINAYVQQAVAAGGEVPAAMKPIIDSMIQQGLLVDANGNAYGSAEDAGITYAQTMSQMFQDLIKNVQSLVDAIRGIPDKTVTVTVNKRTTSDGSGGDDGSVSGGDGGGGETRRDREGFASGGVFEPRPGGHVIRIAEGGQPEAVLNPGQMAAMAGGSPEALAELREMNQSLRRMPAASAVALRDVLMMGRR